MSNPRPRVSVLIPTYNRADLVCGAIDSVLAQTYPADEIIVMDDGSTDDTQAVLQRYDTRIKYVYLDHAGPAAARNAGFQAATGDLLCLLDSDDLYYPHKLRLQVDFFERYPDSVMVYTNFSAFDDAGYWDEFHLMTYHKSAYRRGEAVYAECFPEVHPLRGNAVLTTAGEGRPHWLERSEYRGQLFQPYLYDTLVFTNSMMFRRELLSSIGLQEARFGHFHDLEFALRVCKAGLVGFIDNPTYKLRYHPGQVSAIRKPDGSMNAIKLQRDLLRVARVHALAEARRNANSRGRVHEHIARLCRAAAVPLIGYDGPNAHRRRSFPRRARRYLGYAAAHGDTPLFLYFASYLPMLGKRMLFAAQRVWRNFLAAARRPA